MASPLIAVIEDEEHLAQGLLFNLEAEGYRTHHEADGDAALAWLLNAPEPPAAVLLDVMLPGQDGFSIVRALREAGRFTPVLLLTARGRSEDVVEGFSAGADDYLPKPFDLNVLLARLSGLLRRVHWAAKTETTAIEAPAPVHDEPPQQPTFILGDRTIDLEALEIRGPGDTIHLTVMEADLLRYLLERPGKIIARKELLENVWRVHEDTDTRAIDNFLVRLRRYLEPDPAHPAHFVTVRGVGYRFVAEP
jgi:DNA-binding response OmpR family regulator